MRRLDSQEVKGVWRERMGSSNRIGSGQDNEVLRGMQSHLILGLLRDGRLRHGYELIIEYTARSGTRVSAGCFYRGFKREACSGVGRAA